MKKELEMIANNVKPSQLLDENGKKVPFLKKITPYDVGGVPGEIHFCLGDGSAPIVFHLAQASGENVEHATVHGFSQKIGDEASGFSGLKDYIGAREALEAMRDRMYSPDWNKGTREGGENAQGVRDLAQAIATLKKLAFDDVLAEVQKADAEQRKLWRKHAKIDAIIKDILAERAKARAEATQDEDLDFSL